MKYIIMCGGSYKEFETPKQLYEVNGERIVDRTIRLLRENGIKDIFISATNPLFDTCDAIRIEHKNDFQITKNGIKGYWLDAFYPTKEPTCYLWGDVYFSDNAIKTIVNYKTDKNILFGNEDALNIYHNNWGEPFAYIVNDYKTFFNAIEELKKLKDANKLSREPIVWEIYRYLHNLPLDIQTITNDYVVINDGTIDIDSPEDIKRLGIWK